MYSSLTQVLPNGLNEHERRICLMKLNNLIYSDYTEFFLKLQFNLYKSSF